MIRSIITFSIQHKIYTGLFVVVLLVWGIWSVIHLPLDAVPDITNNQVQVISIAPTLATQEVEKYITAPIEVAVATVSDIVELRSISRLGLSVVTIVFKDAADIFRARQQISERLKEAETQIPQGVTHPEMAPVTTGLGEVYQYLLRVGKGYEGKYSLTDLRTIQDWIVKRELLGTPGVAEVNSYGGYVKEYEVAINPDRLKSMKISVPEIFTALEENNENTGSAYIEKGQNSYFIRGVGLAGTLEDIGNIVVRGGSGRTPVLIRDLAEVRFGHAIRYGALICDTSEVVGGVVMMLRGANATEVVTQVKKRMEMIASSLPEGLFIEPYLDRTDLVRRAVGTVTRNLVEGGLIVILVLVLMLGSIRAGLVVASVIPLSMLFAISMMKLFGISGNLMSLGAIDFGLIVDGAVIIVENVVHRLSLAKSGNPGFSQLSRKQMDHYVLESSKNMMSSATFGQIIILVVYLPILSLVGIEGKMFRPMAQTVGLAIIGAIILSLTYVPVISSLVMNRKQERGIPLSEKLMQLLHRLFEPVFGYALGHKVRILVVTFILSVAALWMFLDLGGEFIPTLEEGDLASGIMTLQGGSLTHTVETVKKANKILKENFPEVKYAVCKVGAGEIPTDPTPVETGDYIITMRDKSLWTSVSTREEMVEKMKEKVGALPGVAFSFQQPISMRFNELMTGSKQDVAVKIFGDDLDILAGKGEELAAIIEKVNGVQDIQVEKVTGAPQISVVYNRTKMARYGLRISDVNEILRTAFAGNRAGVIYENEKRFDLVVRFTDDFRHDIENVRQLYLPLDDGRQIPLAEVAEIGLKNGTAQVSRENGKRRVTVSFNVRGRDVQSIIGEVRQLASAGVKLPPGYFITYGGQFENLVEARNRLLIVVPLALVLIFILLFFTFHSVKQTLLIFSAVPLAAIGGVFALYLRGMNFSISAGVGFIALFGVAVLNGIVLVTEFNRLEREGMTDLYQRVIEGLKSRLRPILMTASVASLGFLPMAVSTSAGAEVQKPLATVVIGGLVSSTLLTIIVMPVLYILLSGTWWQARKKLLPGPLLVFMMAAALCLVSSFPAGAQVAGAGNPGHVSVYTLQQALDQAMTRNGMVKRAVMEVENRKILRQTDLDFENMEFGFSYGRMNSARQDDELTVSQRFLFPSTYVMQSRVGREMVEQAGLMAGLAKNEVSARVKSTYYELAWCHARLTLLKFQDSIFGNFLHAALSRYQKGETSLLERMTAESQLLAVKNRIGQATADIRIRECRLQTLINESNEIRIADTILVRLKFAIPPDSNTVVMNPSLLLLKSQVKLAKLEKNAEVSRILPGITLGYFTQSNREISPTARFTGFQGGLSLPILYSGRKGKIESAGIQEKMAREEFQFQSNSLSHSLHILLQEYEKYSRSVDYYETQALRQAQLLLDQAGISYRAGAIDYMEYVQNLRLGIEIRENYLETLNAYNQSVIALELLTNRIN
ncbi:MAG: CusA/CzcA family heavy metal efflux RND transporter [Bacteroidota bacterium]